MVLSPPYCNALMPGNTARVFLAFEAPLSDLILIYYPLEFPTLEKLALLVPPILYR